MTYAEIIASIEGAQKCKRESLQFQAVIAYRQSDFLASLVARVFGGKNTPPSLHEAFPGIFPEQEQPRQQNWQLMKARIDAYAAERRKRGEKRGDDA